jgi:hypothetical protein
LVIAAISILIGAGTLLFAGESVTDSNWIGAVLIVLGIGIGVHARLTGQTPGAHLRVDTAGVYFREWGVTVPWREIADVYQSGSRLQPFVTLRIGDPERLLAGLPQEEARKLKRNHLWKSPELRIPYSAVEASRDEILAAIQNGMRDRDPPVA